MEPPRVSVKSLISTPVAALLKSILSVPALVLRGSGVTAVMLAVSGVVSTTRVPEGFATAPAVFNAFPAASNSDAPFTLNAVTVRSEVL